MRLRNWEDVGGGRGGIFTKKLEIGESIRIRYMDDGPPDWYQLHVVEKGDGSRTYVACPGAEECRKIRLNETNGGRCLHDMPTVDRYRARIWNHTSGRAEVFTHGKRIFGIQGIAGIALDEDIDLGAVDLKIECVQTRNAAFPRDYTVKVLPNPLEISEEMREEVMAIDVDRLTGSEVRLSDVVDRLREMGVLDDSSDIGPPIEDGPFEDDPFEDDSSEGNLSAPSDRANRLFDDLGRTG